MEPVSLTLTNVTLISEFSCVFFYLKEVFGHREKLNLSLSTSLFGSVSRQGNVEASDFATTALTRRFGKRLRYKLRFVTFPDMVSHDT